MNVYQPRTADHAFVLFDVLRHRIILSFEAEAAGIDQDRVVQRILDVVAVA